MRVIGGKYRRRTLRTLHGLALRPTSDRLRETLFDILGASVEGTRWVDLFAGTGAVGIEALSRGAAEAVFIENHRHAVELIRQNLLALKIGAEASVITADAHAGVARLAARGFIADVIFLDPPYEQASEYTRILSFLGASPMLAISGIVIAEHARRHPLPEKFSHFARVRVLEQGDAALSFYRPIAQDRP